MRYGALFLVLGVSVAALGALIGGAGGTLLLWPALSFVIVGVAYLTSAPAALGKRQDGTHDPRAIALLSPYLALAWSIWRVERAVSREDACNEVAPGLWVGRRPLGHEIPPGVRLVVDLSAELPASADVRSREGYVCAPVLDGEAPAPEALRALIDRLGDETGILVHCASGHGRSATVAAALMIARGLASDVDDAEAKMRAKRPGIRINAAQRERLREVCLPPMR